VVQKRTHVFLPEGVLSDIDQLFGKEKRSAFLTEIVEREVRKQKLLRALDDAAGWWKAENHPELENGSAAFVRALRDGSDAYLAVAAITNAAAALFQTQDKVHRLTGLAISRRDMLRVVKTRCAQAGLPDTICNHTFRGTGITAFLQNGGSLEAAQDMANHSDPRTTKLYDRREDLATLSEIERRIAF